MQDETGKAPKALPDEALDEAAGGVAFGGTPEGETSSGFTGGVNKDGITDGTSNTGYTGFTGGVRVAVGDINNDAAALKIADGSVKPGA